MNGENKEREVNVGSVQKSDADLRNGREMGRMAVTSDQVGHGQPAVSSNISKKMNPCLEKHADSNEYLPIMVK